MYVYAISYRTIYRATSKGHRIELYQQQAVSTVYTYDGNRNRCEDCRKHLPNVQTHAVVQLNVIAPLINLLISQ